MELQLLFKSAKAFVFAKNERLPTEQEDFLRLDCLDQFSKSPGKFDIEAKVPWELGRSEKFCVKSGIDSALERAGMKGEGAREGREGREGKEGRKRESVRVDIGENPLSVGHIFHKKVIHAYSPGVVRLKPKEPSPGKSRLSTNLRFTTTPQPISVSRPQQANPDKSCRSFQNKHISPLQKLSSTIRRIKPCESSRFMKPCDSTHRSNNLLSRSVASVKPELLTSVLQSAGKTEQANPNPNPNPRLTKNPHQSPVKSFVGSLQNGHLEGYCEVEYDDGDWFKGFMKKDQKLGQGKYFYSQIRATYKGEFLNDLPNGAGKLKLDSGEYVKAGFKEGRLADGPAVLRLKDGLVYEGKLVDGKRTGEGRIADEKFEFVGSWAEDRRTGLGFVKSEEFSFEGSFSSDYTDGPGVLLVKAFRLGKALPRDSRKGRAKGNDVLKDGLIGEVLRKFSRVIIPEDYREYAVFICVSGKMLEGFEGKGGQDGRFLAGKLCGAGVAQYGSFGTYIGTFKEGLRSGFGKMQYTDPNNLCNLGEFEGEYQGFFQDNLRHGPGQMTWPGGIVYKGSYNRDRRHQVQGQLVFKSGDVYEGTWINDRLEGQCRLIKRSLTVQAQFINGQMASQASIQYQDGRVYSGTVVNLSPHGHGQMKWPNGRVYRGDFCDGVIDGSGRMVYPNGDLYEGLWENGKRAGRGKMTYASGTKYEGDWLDDCRNGEGTLKDLNSGDVVHAGFWNHDEVVN